MKFFSLHISLSRREILLFITFLLFFFIFENFLLDFFLQKINIFPRTYFYSKLILVIIFFISNFIGGILLVKFREVHILLPSIFLIWFSTGVINLLRVNLTELNFWLIIPYTVAMGLIPVVILNYLNGRMELLERQKQMSNILLITFIALILCFYAFFIFYEFYIILNIMLTIFFLFFLKTKVNKDNKFDLKSKNVTFLEFLSLMAPFFFFFVAFFISNILFNSFLFYRSISGSNFFIFLIGCIGAIFISNVLDFLGRKVLILSSFFFIGLNWIFSSMFGYTILISIFDGITYGLMISIGIFTLSGDIIVGSNLKLKSIFLSLFLAPIFLYDLLVNLFLYYAVESNWIIFEISLNWSRTSLFSLMLGLDLVGLVIFNYSPETFPSSKRQRFIIERYMIKARKIADKFK